MALRTKSIYEPRGENDGTRVLVTRFYPRGVKRERFDRWTRELSPSRELLRAYRAKEKSWGVFRSEFIAELKKNPSSMAAIHALRSESRNGTVTLLCYERPGLPCHRYVVVELVKNQRRPRPSGRDLVGG
ncbi:MAG: DUF488 family protein [Thaumarchaeota archaeon]|nr:DUF488 family protein [Nitrososphaerota archaeon]